LTWRVESRIQCTDPGSGAELATLESGKVLLSLGSTKRANFDALRFIAGGSRTTFALTSALLTFDASGGQITEGQARAAVFVEDLNFDGVAVRAAEQDQDGILLTRYNGSAPDAERFADLLGEVVAGPDGSASAWQIDPSFGYRAIEPSAESMSSFAAFSLTSGDVCEFSAKFAIRVSTPPGRYFRDADADGYGSPGDWKDADSPPTGYVDNAGNCNDADSDIHPGATERCNGVDDNCDGRADEGFEDNDGDGTVDGAGDLECDGLVNFDDISPFSVALTSREEYERLYPGCDWFHADINGDGSVDFADIDAFVALLGG
jgi:hypothetical protein